MNHPRHRIRLLTVPLAAAGIVVSAALSAWAHVEVEAAPTAAGASNVTLTFHVPNEEAPAVTTEVTFVMPTDHPLVGVAARPQNGFKPTTTTRHLAVAVPGTHGPVSDVASQVTFSGGKITGKDEIPFVLHVDKLPAGVRTLTFKALQRYSNGKTVSWIEVAADGAAEPEHPAPVLSLAKPASGSSAAASVTAVAPALPAPSPRTDAGLPAVPLGLGILILGSAGAVLLVRRGRSSHA